MASKTSPKATSKKSKVFLVDDHAILRQGLAELINDQEDLLVCGEAESPPEAVRLIESTKPDVAVIDITLKNGDGIELCRQLRERWPATALASTARRLTAIVCSSALALLYY